MKKFIIYVRIRENERQGEFICLLCKKEIPLLLLKHFPYLIMTDFARRGCRQETYGYKSAII